MAKRKRKVQRERKKFDHWTEVMGVVLMVFSLLGMLSPFVNMGPVGQISASFAMFLVGVGYEILLLSGLVLGFYLLWKRDWPDFLNIRFIGIYLIVVCLLVLMHMNYIKIHSSDVMKVFDDTLNNLLTNFSNSLNGTKLTASMGGGIIGAAFGVLFYKLFSTVGTYIVCGVLIALGIVFLTGIDLIGILLKPFKRKKRERKPSLEDTGVIVNDSTVIKEALHEVETKEEENKIKIHSIEELHQKEEVKAPINDMNISSVGVLEDAKEVKINDNTNYNYKLPPLSILSRTKSGGNGTSEEQIQVYIEKLEKVLKDFGIVAKVVEVNVGPSVTQYELEISSGTKMSKITGLSKEISLALAKKDVRIQAPIPGKGTVGIELANDATTPVGLREILESFPQNKEKNKLMVALGKNIMGNSIFCEIDKTPHLLVAGATGSGKSVCINCIIASILMRAKPNEVKLMLVDPKKVELSMYNGIPHLITPVVTDPRKANDGLKRIVHEMEMRYDTFSEKNVKNIATYNEWVDKQNEGRNDEDKIPHMPYIVVIVDELADLMLVASKEVEDSIMRITQMARAAGIHLIIATQRPSTDVITGVIKANIPSRIAFAVSSNIDSRTILDQGGAEKLLGKGDMLFSPIGEITPTRVQGAYVSDEDLEKIVNYTIGQQKAQYDDKFNLDVSQEPVNEGGMSVDDVKGAPEEYDDPLYNEIVDFAVMSGKISASLIQRKYRLGYNRAARIIDLLEERGIIGPQNGSKPREVLIKIEEE